MKSEAVSGNTALDLRSLGHPLCHLRSRTYLALMIPDAFVAGDFSTAAASAATLIHQRCIGHCISKPSVCEEGRRGRCSWAQGATQLGPGSVLWQSPSHSTWSCRVYLVGPAFTKSMNLAYGRVEPTFWRLKRIPASLLRNQEGHRLFNS